MLELASLVRRDHEALHEVLRALSGPLSEAESAAALHRVQAQFSAHAEAEAIALGELFERVRAPGALSFLVSQVTAAHLAQESALAALLAERVGTPPFRERVRTLRQLVLHHADHEAACLHPALADHLPREVHRALAASYGRERASRLARFPPAIARSA